MHQKGHALSQSSFGFAQDDPELVERSKGNIALIPLIIFLLVLAGVVFFLIFKGVIKNPFQI